MRSITYATSYTYLQLLVPSFLKKVMTEILYDFILLRLIQINHLMIIFQAISPAKHQNSKSDYKCYHINRHIKKESRVHADRPRF